LFGVFMFSLPIFVFFFFFFICDTIYLEASLLITYQKFEE